jgi:hypothetical protein
MAIHKVDGVDGDANFPKKFVRLYAAAAVAKGDWVMIDVADTTNGLGASVKKTTGGTAAGDPAFGIAVAAISAGTVGTIQTAGKYGDETAGGGANVHTDAAAGKYLAAGNGGGAGTANLMDSAITEGSVCGLALNAAGAGDYGANECTVIIVDQGLF